MFILAYWFLLASFVGMNLVLWDLIRERRLSVRREVALLAVLDAIESLRSNNGSGVEAVQTAYFALNAEIAAQGNLRRWQRPPRLGTPWPGQELPALARSFDPRSSS